MLALQERIAELFVLYLKDELSPNDKVELDIWLSQSEENRQLFEFLSNEERLKEELAYANDAKKRMWATLQKNKDLPIAKVVPIRRSFSRTMVAAVAVMAMVITGLFLWFNNPESKKQAVTNTNDTGSYIKDDIPAPIGNKAVLTLEDGSTIVLDNAENGALIDQGAVQVLKNGDQLTYKASKPPANNEVRYNTLSTQNGGFYRLQLPDASRVWLNAASSITYPTAFTGDVRKVTIKGEAYFEVTPNSAKPFYVTANGVQVQVLGTHFNINAYDDLGAVNTTLLEGKVKVSKANRSIIIKPGQQAQVDDQTKVINADIEQVMAWKEGLFLVKKADIHSIMGNLAKWYDVKVQYKGAVTGTFSFEIPKTEPLSRVLKLLELTNKIHFKVEGKTITVMP
jgi:transmembrane sensor